MTKNDLFNKFVNWQNCQIYTINKRIKVKFICIFNEEKFLRTDQAADHTSCV
jgi:hypothetical protein